MTSEVREEENESFEWEIRQLESISTATQPDISQDSCPAQEVNTQVEVTSQTETPQPPEGMNDAPRGRGCPNRRCLHR